MQDTSDIIEFDTYDETQEWIKLEKETEDI